MFTARPAPRRKRGLTRLVLIFSVLAFGANLIYTASSKSTSRPLPKAAPSQTSTRTVDGKQGRLTKVSEALSTPKMASLVAMPQATPTPEGVGTYDATCTNVKSAFELGDTVCVKLTGLPDLQVQPRSVTLNNTGGIAIERTELISNQITFTIPSDPSYAIDNQTGDNRGLWQVKLVPGGRSVVRANAFFTVADPTSRAADLTVYNAVLDPIGDVPDGANVTVGLTVTNNGPDAAPDAQLTALVPSNATFVSASQDSGPTFNCTHPAVGGTGSSVCTISNLASGAQAQFTFVYNVNSGVPRGTIVASTAAIGQITSPSSVISELNSRDNQWTARAVTSINTNTPSGCVLACPANILVTANTTQGTQAGAIVTFDAAEPGGSCGTITASTPSGSFFPVGTTTVTSTSSAGGGSCTFTVTVVEVAAPTITCQADQTASATGNQLEVPVTLNPPSTTGNGVRLDGTRSDGLTRGLTDPYPIGTTIITWTATETFQETDPQTNDPITVDGRAVSCTQRIIVTSTGAPTISCPSDKSFNATSGCEITVTAGDIGAPTASGSNVTVTSRRSDDLALTDPFPAGTTTITWTATDDVDRVASCTQKITVTTSGGGDTTPPTLDVPADITTTTSSCSVLLDDELGVATADDNCSSSVNITRTGIPTVACQSNPNGCETFVFPTGTTNITYTATDAAGNTTVKIQKVTVTEAPAVPPTIAAPANVTLFTGPGATSCGVTVSDLDAALGTATASDNCALDSVTRSGVPAGNVFPIGPTTVTYTAKDKSGNTASANQTVTVVDNTVPTIVAPAAVTLYTGAGATSCDVTVSDLNAALGTPQVDDNCPNPTWARTGVPAGNVFPLGNTTVSYKATDANGNQSATVTQVVTVVDNTPPVIAQPANITVQLPLNSTATSMPVTFPNPSATDNCAGTITFAFSPVSGSTFPVGPTTVTLTATDAHGNSAQTTFTVTVLYNFTGFFSPVNNTPTLNVVNAGRAIPVKFSLSGNKGLGIFAANSPQSGIIPCDGSAPAVDLTETVTAGGSSLSYTPDQYNYTWKTENSWAGTCRQLVLTLNDGSVHIANFKFK